MEDIYFKKIMTTLIFIILVVLSFFILKPILLSIIFGIIMAFIFSPVFHWFFKLTGSKNLSGFLVCGFLILLIVLPIWFLTPILIDQSFRFFQASQNVDFVTPLKSFFPNLFASEQFSAEIGAITQSFVTKMTSLLMNYLSGFILNFPTITLQFFVVFFTFFFVLRDREIFVSYIRSLLPFSKDVQNDLFESSNKITYSVIYGQIVIGVIQGLILGIGLFIFQVPNALILTMLACLSGIFPLIGTVIIWVPVVVYLLLQGNTFSTMGITIFGIVSSSIDNILRPIIVSKRTKVHSSLILTGMVGGVFFFGVLGFVLGPLILAYLLIILDIYRGKKYPDIFNAHK